VSNGERYVLGPILRTARGDRSLAELARATGLSKQYLVGLENRPSNPTVDVLVRIADATGQSALTLLAGALAERGE
jgi:transcriptional regulator with XRE-family HTH domain